jgi:hypothetical protein
MVIKHSLIVAGMGTSLATGNLGVGVMRWLGENHDSTALSRCAAPARCPSGAKPIGFPECNNNIWGNYSRVLARI